MRLHPEPEGLNRYNLIPRKRGRVVDCTGLENRRLEKVREFESHRFRHVNRFYAGLASFDAKLPRPLPQNLVGRSRESQASVGLLQA